MEPGPRDAKQRTLFDLRKVVKLDTSSVCFQPQDIEALKPALADPNTTKYQLLNSLRKLDCYKLQLADLVATQIGSTVATLTQHPRVEVARLAAALVDKWKGMADEGLFHRLPYDVEAAAAAPEGAPEEFFLKAPPTAFEIAAAEAAAAVEERKKTLRQRLRAEEKVLDSSDEEEAGKGSGNQEGAEEEEDAIESDNSSDEDWCPNGGAAKRRQQGKGSSSSAKQQTKRKTPGDSS